MGTPSEIQVLTAAINRFREERDWKQFHKPKDLAISLTLEAAELLEHFQWRSDDEVRVYVREHKEDVADEIADVFNYLLQLADDLEIDVIEASYCKLEKNAKKYPVAKSRGNHRKYTEHNQSE